MGVLESLFFRRVAAPLLQVTRVFVTDN